MRLDDIEEARVPTAQVISVRVEDGSDVFAFVVRSAIRASSDPGISNPERFTLTRRDHPRSLRRRHRAIHFRQAFGWVVRPAVDTATISCLCGRRRARSCRYGQNAGSGEHGKNDGYVRKHICISQDSADSHSRENHTFQERPNRPPSVDPARPRQQRRASQRFRAQRRDRSSHLCSVASYQLLHLAPVNPATSRLVRLLAIRACGTAHSAAGRSGSRIR